MTMKKNQRLATGFASIILVGTLATAGMASAAGSEGSGGRVGHSVEEKCSKQAEIEARAAQAQQRINERITALQTKRAEAEAAGKTEKVTKIDARIAKLNQLLEKITSKLARYEIWVTANCS